ncbi:hypothetical protein [Amycolatopsis jejuensis]|uniref:hypothetical protein n=1 Tax=Amycolatopsis jejuensis TaxID=330084 RepID=UPI0005278762|nr:hypothetical protein [Amycolatopsis jejuensis]
MDFGTTLAVAGVTGLFGLVILVVLWPGERQGVRLLTKWGVRNPAPDQVSVAVRYLRRRRFWYPWLFVGLPLLPGAEQVVGEKTTITSVLVVVLLGGLIAEIFAQRPSRQPRREAVLAPRGVLDFVPLWTIIVAGLATIAAVAHLAATRQWTQLAVTAGAAAVSWLVVLLAVRRPAAGDPEVDLALRIRSARVALGLGTGTAATLGWTAGNLASFLAFVVTVAAFLAIVGPPPKPRTTTTAAR